MLKLIENLKYGMFFNQSFNFFAQCVRLEAIQGHPDRLGDKQISFFAEVFSPG